MAFKKTCNFSTSSSFTDFNACGVNVAAAASEIPATYAVSVLRISLGVEIVTGIPL